MTNKSNTPEFDMSKIIDKSASVLVIGKERTAIIDIILEHYKTTPQLRLHPYDETLAKAFATYRGNVILNSPIRLYRGDHDASVRSIVILDTDIDYDKSPAVQSMVLNTDHIHMLVVIGQATHTRMPPDIRVNINYIFLNKNIGMPETLCKYYGDYYGFLEFKEALDKTSDTCYMVLDMQKDKIYYLDITKIT
jgi:hypothetical protein